MRLLAREPVKRLHGQRVAVFHAEFAQDVTDVFLNSEEAQAEQLSDLAVLFAVGDPEQDVGFAQRETKLAQTLTQGDRVVDFLQRRLLVP